MGQDKGLYLFAYNVGGLWRLFIYHNEHNGGLYLFIIMAQDEWLYLFITIGSDKDLYLFIMI
jgi:hypothetical protein